MAYIPYSDFLSEVLPYLRDCPEIAATNAIRNSCIEFCQKSHWLRYNVTDIEIVVGQTEYDMDIPLQTEVATVIAANIGAMPLEPKAEEELRALFGADWRTVSSGVSYITHDNPNILRVVGTPNTLYEDPLRVVVSLRPQRNSKTVDSRLHSRWAEVIGHGARARLSDTSGQPYSNTDDALRFRRWFATGYNEAKADANRGFGRSTLVVRMPRFI